MALSTNPYCDVEDVKTALDPQMGTTDDPFIQQLIVQAQSVIDAAIGYSFQQDGTPTAPVTRLYDGSNPRSLVVDPMQLLTQVVEVQRVTQIGSNGVWQLGSILTVDITADCVLTPNNNPTPFILKRISGVEFLTGLQNYQVTGVFGQPVPPAGIQRATIRLAVHWFKMRDTNYADTMSEQGGVREKYQKSIPDDVKEIISFYKHSLFVGGSR